MKKLLVLLVTVLAFNLSSAQGIVKTVKPIYNKNGLEIKKLWDNGKNDKVILLFRNAKYKYIIDTETIIFDSKSDLSLFFDKIVEMLEAPKTSKDEDLKVIFDDYQVLRYGFAQSVAYLLKDNGGYIRITKGVAKQVIKSLNN